MGVTLKNLYKWVGHSNIGTNQELLEKNIF